MAETIRDVIIKIKIEQEDVKLKVPKTQPLEDAFKKIGDTVEDEFKNINKELETVEKGIGDVEKELKKLEDERAKALKSLHDDQIKVADGFKTMGEGAFTVTRGVTLLGITTEENMSKVIQKVAKAQAGFDLFKGSTDIVKGVKQATDALGFSLNPLTIAAGATAAAIGGIALVMQSLKLDPLKEITRELEKQEETLRSSAALFSIRSGAESELRQKHFTAELALIDDPGARVGRVQEELDLLRAVDPTADLRAAERAPVDAAQAEVARRREALRSHVALINRPGRSGSVQDVQRDKQLREQLAAAERAAERITLPFQRDVAGAELRQSQALENLIQQLISETQRAETEDRQLDAAILRATEQLKARQAETAKRTIAFQELERAVGELANDVDDLANQ